MSCNLHRPGTNIERFAKDTRLHIPHVYSSSRIPRKTEVATRSYADTLEFIFLANVKSQHIERYQERGHACTAPGTTTRFFFLSFSLLFSSSNLNCHLPTFLSRTVQVRANDSWVWDVSTSSQSLDLVEENDNEVTGGILRLVMGVERELAFFEDEPVKCITSVQYMIKGLENTLRQFKATRIPNDRCIPQAAIA